MLIKENNQKILKKNGDFNLRELRNALGKSVDGWKVAYESPMRGIAMTGTFVDLYKTINVRGVGPAEVVVSYRPRGNEVIVDADIWRAVDENADGGLSFYVEVKMPDDLVSVIFDTVDDVGHVAVDAVAKAAKLYDVYDFLQFAMDADEAAIWNTDRVSEDIVTPAERRIKNIVNRAMK